MASNIELVQNIYAAMARRDVPGVLALIDEQICVVQAPELPWGGEYSGTQGMIEFFQRLLACIDSKPHVEELFEAGNRVVVIGRTKGKVLTNNAPFDIRLVHIWTIENGKATRFEPHIDTPHMLEALDR